MENKKIVIDITETKEFMPDMVKFSLDFTTVSKKYETAVNDCQKKSIEFSKRLDELKSLGIKTGSDNFNISQIKNPKNNTLTNDGFKCVQHISIVFKNKSELIKSVLEKVIYDEAPTFSVNFFLSNPGKYSDLLIEKAINTAKNKAEIMAKAINKKLGDVVQIDYHGNYNHSPQILRCATFNNSVTDDFVNALSPSPVSLSENISITFEIQ